MRSLTRSEGRRKMAATEKQWYVGEDGCIPIGEPANSVTYHSALNSIIVTTNEPAVKIYDVTSGSVLQKSNLSAKKGDVVRCMYLPDKDKMVFCDSHAVGVRRDLRGVLMLDTALQVPVVKAEDNIKLELPLADASQLLKCLTTVDLTGIEFVEDVVKELEKQIDVAQEATKGNHKTTKWAAVCIDLPHHALKNVCSRLVSEMKRLNQHSAGLSIASAVTDRLGYLLPSSLPEVGHGPAVWERTLMYSEATRRETFTKWPHMNYKWALPDPMAQAGFYHQPNASGDDRAMCFTCNVCLVCWEPTDEPWSEHERHSPSCPFVKGEHTQNVPLSVTYATQPACLHGEQSDKIACISTTCSEDYMATSTKNGKIVVWNLSRMLKKHCQFNLDPTETVVALKTRLQVERLDTPMVDSLELLPQSKGAEGMQTETVDAAVLPEEMVSFSVGESSMEEETLHELPVIDEALSQSMSSSWARPCEDIVVSSLCLVEKAEEPVTESPSHSKSDKAADKKRLRQLQPSLICGVSFRRTRLPLNCEENGGGGSDVKTEVQLMNKVNEVVSGDTSPHIIPNSEGSMLPGSDAAADEDFIGSTVFIPYLLVVAVKEDVKKVSKQPSMDSLKPSSSTSNMVPTLESITMNQDWGLLDHMYDSDPDPDCQIIKVSMGPESLSASSPTEGSKPGMESSDGSQKQGSESAIRKPFVVHRAGTILQCIELPKSLQSESLEIKSISPTLDRQHIVVVVAPVMKESQKTSVSVISNSSNCSAKGGAGSSQAGAMDNSSTSSDVHSPGQEEVKTVEQDSSCDAGWSHGCILVYQLSYDCDSSYAQVKEEPVVVRHVDSTEESVVDVLVLPREISDQTEEEVLHPSEDDLVKPTTVPSSSIGAMNRKSGPFCLIAVTFASGKMSVLNSNDLSVLADIIPPAGDKFKGVTYCSGMDRLCMCSEEGKLYFYQLSEDCPDQSDSMVEGDVIPVMDTPEEEAALPGDSPRKHESFMSSPRPAGSGSELLAKQPLTFENLSALHNLISFENLMPRFTATVPPCWSEIQQEQQQRRHPQHLQHQGEATQHTRTWKLQLDSNTWDEHLFEIVLPKVCCVGHVDVKFSLNPQCGASPKIQVTLLKQNINAIGRQANNGMEATCSSIPVDSKINFNMKSSSYNSDESDSSSSSSSRSPTYANNVLDPLFLECHNAEILCGPVNISNCLDLSGNSGLVSLTSPQLLISKPRSFLLHIKGFPIKKTESTETKPKETRKRPATPVSQAHEKHRTKTIKSLFENCSSVSVNKTKVENQQGCDWLQELSITIRKTKKTTLPKERMQRNAMIELTSFQEKLLSTVSFQEGYLLPGVSPDQGQNMAMDILIWITNIQMNDPDKRTGNKCILTTTQQRLKEIVQACYIQGTRTTAHKATRLLALCMEFCKSSIDADLAPMFSLSLLDALLGGLPQLPSAYSASGVKWFFTLLNRVKCMDVSAVSQKCAHMLHCISKQFHERSSVFHALLKARYGLNGHPFEPELFDMDLPATVKQIIPSGQLTPTYTCGAVSSTGSNNTSMGNSQQQQPQQQADELDFTDLFSLPADKSPRTQMEYARNHILGMLEVEPLHFTCHSTSDGTKMERMDNASSTGTTAMSSSGLWGPNFDNSGLSGTINFGETLPNIPQPTAAPTMPSNLPYSLSPTLAVAKHQLQELSTKTYPTVKHKIMHIKQILSEVGKNLPIPQKTGNSELLPPTPKTTPQVMTPPLTPPNEAWQQILQQTEKQEGSKSQGVQSQRPAMPLPQPHALLQPPHPQVLVIERIYSGARRFVILDFGKPILLTDVIIPSCGDLASLSIDVWVQGEEIDGQRLVVASDIGARTLVMNNIMPPPVCRFLKITTIGRYGSGTSRSKIPIGAFYGHSYILPWEWSMTIEQQLSPSSNALACQLDFPSQSQLLTHLGSFMSLLEDIQCRYSLARTRLENLLTQVESLQYASAHTQYFLKKNKKNDEDNSILQTYNDCLQLQLQQNLAQRAIDRLQSAIGLRVPITEVSTDMTHYLKQASTDKLRYMMESLLETVISVTSSTPSIPQSPVSLYKSLDPGACENLFKYLCVHGTPRIQVLTGLLLVRVCGSQNWFGQFLGNTLQEYFHSESSQVFSQDRVFFLLTAMGQKSLQGPSSVSIMESLLAMLAKVLSPIHGSMGGQFGSHSHHMDLSLIGWILLFLCRNLDNTLLANGNGEDEGASAKKDKDQGSNLSNRWNFIQASNHVRSQMGKSKSVLLYRQNLQKRLLHHKKKLIDLEHMKKTFLSQENVANHSLLKQQEKQFRKELSQYTSRHLKGIIQIRKTEWKLPKTSDNSGSMEGKDGLDYEQDSVLVLPKERCLPVVHGLMALLLGMDFTCNVDLFLVTCKVLARVCIATRPAITLTEAMTQEQLEKLVMLVANMEFNHGNISWGGPWAGHSITCLLQDILEGERVYPSTRMDGLTDDEMTSQVNETDDSLPHTLSLPTFEESESSIETGDSTDAMASQSKDDNSKMNFDKDSAVMVDMLLDESDDDGPEKLMAYVTGEPSQGASQSGQVMYVQPMSSSNMNGSLDNTNSTFVPGQEMYEEKYKPMKEGLKYPMKAVLGSTSHKPIMLNSNKILSVPAFTTMSQGLSTALDARLECGLETHPELRLRVMLSLQTETLQGAFTAPLPMAPLSVQDMSNGRLTTGNTGYEDGREIQFNGIQQTTSSEMLSRAYDNLFYQLLLHRVNMDALLQLWLTLNEEGVLDENPSQITFDPSRVPQIPLSLTSVSQLLACVASTPSLPVRTWVLVFQSLTLLANLKIPSDTERGRERSMVAAILADKNLIEIITKFLSGGSSGGPAVSASLQSQVGPSAVKAFKEFLQRLHVKCAEDNVQNLKEIMLKLVYSLTMDRGAFQSGLGPLDAQCKFMDFILELTYAHDQVDISNAISVIQCISSLVHQHILYQERVLCKSTSDNGINARSCFGGLFANLLRGGESRSAVGDASRDLLMCSLLKLVNALLRVQFPQRFGRRVSTGADNNVEPLTPTNLSLSDSTKLSQALATSTPTSLRGQPDEMFGQTDEQKTENIASQDRTGNPGSSSSSSATSGPSDHQTVLLADIILGNHTIMCNFIQALSYCNSNTMAMMLGSSGMPINMQDTFTGGDPLSVGDAIYHILTTLTKKSSNNKLILEALFLYLSGGFTSQQGPVLSRLSEPLLWFILKVLESARMLKLFLEMGGVQVICHNFVHCNSRIISTTPSLISTIMQTMNGKAGADKRKKWDTESTEGLQNFAPLGTIVSNSPTSSPAEVLIVSAPQHRRARSAPWSYHFYPDEMWVDLTITLPFAILLKEVQIQPHSPALSTCPSSVSLEASQDGVTFFPLCAPMSTGSLVFIKLQLQRPEVVTSVVVRLHKARDSMTIGLSQILLMGYSAFGDVGYKTNNLFLPTEDFVSRSSVGWIRLLHHCLVSQKEMEDIVAEAATPTPNLLHTCTALLVSPISGVYAHTVEAVLRKLGLHSGEMGLSLIDNLLKTSGPSDRSEPVSHYLGKVNGVANVSTVEILYQLGTVQDRWSKDRVEAMLDWLADSARTALQMRPRSAEDHYSQLFLKTNPGPAPSHVHCIAAILWQSQDLPVKYNLSQLLSKELVSLLYEWSMRLATDSYLKKAIDHILCAICYICPDYFIKLMSWMGIVLSPDFLLSGAIPDDRKDYHSSMTDDSKEASHALGHSIPDPSQLTDPAPVMLQDLRNMKLDESHLSTLALACKSPIAIKQLLESGFPAILAQGLFEFCNKVISRFSESWSQPEGISDSCKSMNGSGGASSSSRGEEDLDLNHTGGMCVTVSMVTAVLKFFSEVSSEGLMKDWLGGADGNIFWPVLLTMLCNTPLQSTIAAAAFPNKLELISSDERNVIETAAVTFFSEVISCHVVNQMLFAKVLCDVIKGQGSASKSAGAGVCPLSGFTRRLFLQVLLEDEKILVAFRAAPYQYNVQIRNSANQIQHPKFGAGRMFRTMLVNIHVSVGELVNKVSDTPSLAAQLLECQADKKSDESKKETSQIGLELVEYISAANQVDVSVDKEPSEIPNMMNQSTGAKSTLPPRPPTRRGRNTTDALTRQLHIPVLCLYHNLTDSKSLPTDLTLSQLMQVLQQHGLPQGESVLEFSLQLHTKGKEGASASNTDLSDNPDEIPDDVLLSSLPFPTALQVFANVGGLALLAEHLPLLCPEISRQITMSESSNPETSGHGDTSQDWVTVDSYPEEFYELYEPMSPAPQSGRGHSVGTMPSIPPHSLVAFGLFLRLHGYADVLLKERKKAQCLLRLVLGVTDDGDGGLILTSPIASSLPTLPFIVLKSLFDATPLTTDDGVLLRRMCLEIGALHLILACLSVLSHHVPRVSTPGFQQETQTILSAMQTPTTVATPVQYTAEEKSQQYWAKGTGFGTGSTTSSWDAEQALLRQKSEEEHVTCLLQVLASYINPGGGVPEDFEMDTYQSLTEKSLLPEVVPELLSQSCLIPALSSYLRNDSVLDMARHVPLYRALLELLRGLAVCPILVMLLLPLEKDGTSGDSLAAIGDLLDKMRRCVDTYASRLKSNKGKNGLNKEEEEENEGLALLIPDIQETAGIVQVATQRLKHKDDKAGAAEDNCHSETPAHSSRESFDEIYLSEIKKLQFDQYEMVVEEGNTLKFCIRHHYENNVKAAGDIKNPNRIRRLAQEAVTLSTSLPLSVSSSVFVRCDEERLDIMKVLITGPDDTPYANGCYEFDVYFPQDYPNAPPYINLVTTGNHTVRFNPNLYNDGKVCLSVLNTWHGRPEEKWNAQTSSFLQVLVSIQSLILVCEPYFNEPGYERSRGTPSGNASSREYDSNIRQANVKWAILEQIKNPSPCFKEVIQRHFWLKRHKILRQCEEWIGEMEMYSNDKRTGRTIALSTMALKRHYNQLREEFAKVKAPEGLENVETDEIDPKEKHYNTDQMGNTSSKDGAGIVHDPMVTQAFTADPNANSVISSEDMQHITAADC